MRSGGTIAKCPSCGSTGIKVINSRPHPFGRERRRKCLGCGHRWSTIEVPMDLMLNLERCSDFREARQTIDALAEIRRNFLGQP